MAKDEKPGPQIVPAPNGPLIYLTDFTPQPIEGLQNPRGEGYVHLKGIALCRCGASEDKPFCDGSHGEIRFNQRRETDGHLDKRKSYVGVKITVHDNRGICSHARTCVEELPQVFDRDARPWINPDGAGVERVIQTVNKCPSGALSYSIEGVEHRDQEREPLITVREDGPLELVGWIEVAGHAGRAQEVSEEHCCLCRCGSSKNKPFCDGAHHDIGFKDEG